MLFQLIDVTYALLVHMVLKIAPNSVVYWIQVGAVRWPEVGQDEVWRDLTEIFDSDTWCTVSWHGVLLEDEQVAGQLADRRQHLL